MGNSAPLSNRSASDGRLALVTGATGYVGGQVAAELLRRGWRVRVLSRSAKKVRGLEFGECVVPDHTVAGPGEVEIVEGDAGDRDVLTRALNGVDCAWYLLHSMGDVSDFAAAERDMAHAFAEVASTVAAKRIVFLGGLHPDGEKLSPHLASRVEVGEILLNSGVPTAALQAGVVIGSGSSSFHMLRHLAERLPAAIAPKWIRNHIQPIAVSDAVHYLVNAADLPPEVNRTFDIGGPEAMPYSDMMTRYATATGRLPRYVATAPVTTPALAAHWIGLVTPVPSSLATPLVGSLLHNTVIHERDIDKFIGTPSGGLTSFDQGVRAAVADVDSALWPRTLALVAGAAITTGIFRTLLASALGAPRPPWWRLSGDGTSLAGMALVSALSLADLAETGRHAAARAFATAMAGYLILTAAVPLTVLARPEAARTVARTANLARSATAAEIVRRAWKVSPQKGITAAAFALWAMK